MGIPSGWLKPWFRRATLIGVIGLLTLVVFAGALYARRASAYPRLSLPGLQAFAFGAYEMGVVFQELVIPLALVSLFSGAAFFQNLVERRASWQDRLELFGVLAVIQLLILNYTTLVIGELATFGAFVVIAGGLLAGWRVGLGLGLVTLLTVGTQELVLYPDEDLVMAYQVRGLAGLLDLSLWREAFLWYYLADLSASSAVWVGLFSGFCARLLGERRFNPLAALGMGVCISLCVISLAAISWQDPTVLAPFLIPGSLISGLAVAGLALVVHSVRSRAAQRRAEAAELAQAKAELRALRAQINPHFLFNALNTIRYFVRTDAETARRLVLDLSAIFQHALRSGEFVPLREEIKYVEAYLALEKTRLDDRLRVVWSVLAEQELDHSVPTLILQPIVENAIVHGVSQQPAGGTVSIDIARSGGDLVLQVTDDGPGIAPERLAQVLGPVQGGEASIGLRNVDGRLRALYGDAYRLTVSSTVGEGTRVQVKVPIEE
jgi:LytS/YehU family sensor histidine kinase